MISFRTKGDSATSLLIIIALLVMVGSTVFAFVPKPKVSGSRSRAQSELESRTEKLQKDVTDAKVAIAAQVWTLPVQEIGPKALETISAYAQKEKIKLISFRPQKVVEVNALNQLPFLISIEGPYPGIMRFLKDLEDAKLKLATTMVQISSTDPSSDKTSATIGVAAYRQLDTRTSTEKPNATKKEN